MSIRRGYWSIKSSRSDLKIIWNGYSKVKWIYLGCYEVSLGDTIGVGTPEKTKNLM